MKISEAALRRISAHSSVFENEIMADHLTMKVGGPAAYYICPSSKTALCESVKCLWEENIPYYVLGNGSNVIVRDEGYDGVIIGIGEALSGISIDGTLLSAGAGALLKDVSRAAADASLSGLEFACGIPGSVGGGTSMNAGAYDGEMKNVVKEVLLINPQGKYEIASKEDMDFSYRHSICSSGNYIVAEATFELMPGNREQIWNRMDELTRKREEKQPLEYPSCGSTFKRPEGYFAGKLIMDSGLRGFRIGGAQVSEKHCGFVINTGNATAADVLTLIDEIKRIVYEKQGVQLECEVKIL